MNITRSAALPVKGAQAERTHRNRQIPHFHMVEGGPAYVGTFFVFRTMLGLIPGLVSKEVSSSYSL